MLQAFRDCPTGFRRKHSHQLLERSERSTELELFWVIVCHFNIADERGVVIRVVPRPALDSFVIIKANPIQGLYIRLADFVSELNKIVGLDSKLLHVELLLETIDWMGKLRVPLIVELSRSG